VLECVGVLKKGKISFIGGSYDLDVLHRIFF
jgi:hypothetical protein